MGRFERWAPFFRVRLGLDARSHRRARAERSSRCCRSRPSSRSTPTRRSISRRAAIAADSQGELRRGVGAARQHGRAPAGQHRRSALQQLGHRSGPRLSGQRVHHRRAALTMGGAQRGGRLRRGVGQQPDRTATPTASSAVATTPRATRWPPSFRSTPTPPRSQVGPQGGDGKRRRLRRGVEQRRPGRRRLRRLRAPFRLRAARRWGRSSR